MWYLDFNFPWPVRLFERPTITAVKWSPSICLSLQKIYKNQLYKVMFQYPFNWQEVHPERYEGMDGFFLISAISAGPNINEVCQNEAFHPLLPYGTQPQILNTMIQNQEACFIIPSSDQPLEMKEQAALIVRYPIPIQIGSMTYNYFILWASLKHIKLIASTIQFKYN